MPDKRGAEIVVPVEHVGADAHDQQQRVASASAALVGKVNAVVMCDERLHRLLGMGRPVEASEAGQCGESVVTAGPALAHGIEAGAAYDAAQHRGDDDGAVGVAQDRDEIGDRVEGYRQVDQQQHQADADAAGQRFVRGQVPDQAQQIGKGPALALWLNRYGADVTVVERAPQLRAGGQLVDIRVIPRA
jgi:hypothetical protein